MWFEPYMAGWIGGIAGGLLGTLASVWGIMAHKFAPKAKYKKFIFAFFMAFIVAGVISLCAGIIAIVTGQPYHVWYIFMFFGILTVPIMTSRYMSVKKIYRQAELNKMNVDDLT